MTSKTLTSHTAASSIGATDLMYAVVGGNGRKVSGTNTAKSLRSLGFAGVRVKRTSDETTANYTAGVDIPWQEAVYDTDTAWAAGTPARLTVPAAWNGLYADVQAYVRVNLSTADTHKSFLLIHLDVADAVKNICGSSAEVGSTSAYLNASFIGVPLVTGDYFVARLQEESDTSITIVAASSGMALRIVG